MEEFISENISNLLVKIFQHHLHELISDYILQNEILFSSKKGQTTNIYKTMNESQKYAWQKMPGTKIYIFI